MNTLEQMKSIDPRTVDRDSLRDIESVNIDTSLSKQERIADFIRQIGNPYCYKHGKYVVKVSFADTGVTLEDRLAGYLASKATSSTGMA
ncbi:DUF6870 family protein [Anaeromusa sp.]|uniref:DUF6870 family protein n=1 Tax=Anaeromusa sp. TaxID=1872520 RepID=UPI00262DF051|nr:hypothetical protein [Anaeromusa sp.]MDD3158756.1 hypothetical protein [Anaeromusa sp.]